MSRNKAIFDVKTQKVTYEPMTDEEITESDAFHAEMEAKEQSNTNN